MWRQYDVALLSALTPLQFLRIYQNPSTNFPTFFLPNITTQGVSHPSPLTTSLSSLFVRWTSEGLLARCSAHYPTRTAVPGSLDPYFLAVSPIDPERHHPAPTLRPVIPFINSDQHCSVQALACTRNLYTGVGLLLVFFLFYFIYYYFMY